MRRICFALLLSAGCITGTAATQHDDRLYYELSRQERWARQAIDARPAPDQLESIRGSDYGSVGAARKEFVKLVQAVDRATWIRDATAELMREDRDPQLPRQFDHAGQLRIEALTAADELASALADAKGGLSVADLRPALNAVNKANGSEDRLARMAMQPNMPKLAPSPMPVPRPFHDSAARVMLAHPESLRELDKLPPEDQARIRAKMADLEREKEEQRHAAVSAVPETATAAAAAAAHHEPANPHITRDPATGNTVIANAPAANEPATPPPSAAPAPGEHSGSAAAGAAVGAAAGAAVGAAASDNATPAPAEMEAPAPSTTLKIKGDAAEMMAKKPPLAITLREDGLFALSYEDGDYLYDPDGKLVRKESPEPPKHQ